MKNTAIRNACIAGAAFGILQFVGILLPGNPPNLNSSPAKIQAFLLDKRQQFVISAVLQVIALPLLIWFTAGLRSLVRGDGSDASADVLSTAVAIGGAVLAALTSVSCAASMITLYSTPLQSASAEAYGIIWNLSLVSLMLAFAGGATLVGAASVGLMRQSRLPNWYNSIGFVIAVAVLALSAIGITRAQNGTAGLLGGILMLAWITITAAVLAIRPAESTVVARGSVATA